VKRQARAAILHTMNVRPPRRTRRFAVSLVVALAAATSIARGEDLRIRLNTVGYVPAAQKRASVAGPCDTFRVVSEPGRGEVFVGRAGPPIHNADTEESIVVADFSEVRTPGVYRLDVPGVGRSPPFRVGTAVYAVPFRTVMRGMYLWRCGCAVSATWGADYFTHTACHTADAFLDYVGGGHTAKDFAGGWHDAGDYNKYVVNAGFSLGVLFQAWEHFGDKIGAIHLNIPESGNRTPDFLNELRWEVDWLLKMQAEDGSVYHKVSTTRFGGFVMPEGEKADRFVAPWSSAATADFVAVTAMAARCFKPYDSDFAARCLAAARRGHAFLLAHPQDHRADLTGFSTGPYQANDAGRRTWAAAELWETTGESAWLKEFEGRTTAEGPKVDVVAGWGNVRNLSVYTYVMSKRAGREPALVDTLTSALVATADGIVKTRDAHGYARPLGTRYTWGCNGDVAQQVQTLHVASRLHANPAYDGAALDALNHLFGRNVYGRSFVTGLGDHPPMHPHDRRSGADKVADPWPGYLVGGGWPKPTDWQDAQENYRTNEIAINWNATLIYALAKFVSAETVR